MMKMIAVSLMSINDLLAIHTVDNFMPFMDYRYITDKTSLQYKVQSDAITDENGFRKIDNKYIVALHYDVNSQKYNIRDILFLNVDGKIKEVIVGDLRPVKGTENVVEFVVDTKKINKNVKVSGNCISILKR